MTIDFGKNFYPSALAGPLHRRITAGTCRGLIERPIKSKARNITRILQASREFYHGRHECHCRNLLAPGTAIKIQTRTNCRLYADLLLKHFEQKLKKNKIKIMGRHLELLEAKGQSARNRSPQLPRSPAELRRIRPRSFVPAIRMVNKPAKIEATAHRRPYHPLNCSCHIRNGG